MVCLGDTLQTPAKGDCLPLDSPLLGVIQGTMYLFSREYAGRPMLAVPGVRQAKDIEDDG